MRKSLENNALLQNSWSVHAIICQWLIPVLQNFWPPLWPVSVGAVAVIPQQRFDPQNRRVPCKGGVQAGSRDGSTLPSGPRPSRLERWFCNTAPFAPKNHQSLGFLRVSRPSACEIPEVSERSTARFPAQSKFYHLGTGHHA